MLIYEECHQTRLLSGLCGPHKGSCSMFHFVLTHVCVTWLTFLSCSFLTLLPFVEQTVCADRSESQNTKLCVTDRRPGGLTFY